jgi:multifunctional methyltransferase subunit TRM112
MKLLTHNLLTSKIIKGVVKGYPLSIEAKRIEVFKSELNREFLLRMLDRIDYDALYIAAEQLGKATDLPRRPPGNLYKPSCSVTLQPSRECEAAASASSHSDSSTAAASAAPATAEEIDAFLQKLHHVLLEVEVQEGSLVCPETGRRFPISDGIPNMLLNEDEV